MIPYILIILVIVIIARNICIVPQASAYVVERFGIFDAVWDAGFHFKVPIISRIAKKVSLKEQVVDFPPQPVITRDNVTMQIDTVVFFQVTDPKLYAYGVERPISAIENLQQQHCVISSAIWSWTTPLPAATQSTARLHPFLTKLPTAGASRLTALN